MCGGVSKKETRQRVFGDWDCVKDLVCWAYGAPCDQSHPDPFASVTSTHYNNQLFYFILCNFFFDQIQFPPPSILMVIDIR